MAHQRSSTEQRFFPLTGDFENTLFRVG